jgi:hypothetical protein
MRRLFTIKQYPAHAQYFTEARPNMTSGKAEKAPESRTIAFRSTPKQLSPLDRESSVSCLNSAFPISALSDAPLDRAHRGFEPDRLSGR